MCFPFFSQKTSATPSFIMQQATEKQKEDKDFVLKAVSRPGIVTGHHYEANPSYDAYYASLYVSTPPYHDLSFHDEMRSRSHFLIEEKTFELQFAGKYKDDKDVVLAAIKYDKEAIKHASSRLQQDIDVKKAANNDLMGLNIMLGLMVCSMVCIPLAITLSPYFFIGCFAFLTLGILTMPISEYATTPKPVPSPLEP